MHLQKCLKDLLSFIQEIRKKTVNNTWLHNRNSGNLMRAIFRIFYINHANIYLGQLTQIHKKNNTQIQQNSHMFAHIIDSRQERERLDQRGPSQKGKKQTKQTEGIQKLFLHKQVKTGYQGFQKSYQEQILRLKLDYVSALSKIRRIFQHDEQGEMSYVKGIHPGIIGSTFPHLFDSLSYTQKTRWNSLI